MRIRKKKLSKLDKVLVSDGHLKFSIILFVEAITSFISDHRLTLLMNMISDYRVIPFKIYNSSMDIECFDGIVIYIL